jgi:predicted RNA-binding Zn-ribbon protein involved in translation (DUF1610 family)
VLLPVIRKPFAQNETMLYNCPTCGQEVSHYAQTCPKCGEPEVGKLAKAHFASVTLPERERAAGERKQLEERAKRQNRRAAIGASIGALAGGLTCGLFVASTTSLNYGHTAMGFGIGFLIGALVCGIIGKLIGHAIGA